MQEVIEKAKAVAPLDINIFIAGETGVGKEEIARLIHKESGRKKFVALNAASLPETLVESELFGARSGSFTGSKNQKGFFEQANGGTFFLDEISKVSLEVQAKLLRVLEEKAFYPVGGRTLIKSNFRFLAASSENLEELVKQGKFRVDLFYRLTACVIEIPPLRERPEDIMPLAEYFVALNCYKMGKPLPLISESAKKKLLSYHWPGNVRELQNVVGQAVISCWGNILKEKDLSGFRNTKKTFTTLKEDEFERPVSLPKAEKLFITEALKRNYWSISATARELEIERDALRYRIKKFGIQHPYGGWLRHERIINQENLIRALKEGGSIKRAAFLLGTSSSHLKLLLKQYEIEYREEAEKESEKIKVNTFNLKRNIEKLEKKIIKKVLTATAGNKTEASRLLGIHRPELYKKMKKYGLPDNFGKLKEEE
jgi:transcriptional regulator with PAS, ATPase and Fis domain